MIHLSRDQYRAEMQFRLRRFLAPSAVAQVLNSQYPRTTELAVHEMTFRGVAPPALPDREDWTASEIDAVCSTLESAGMLTDEALAAQRAGLTMEDIRLRERPEETVKGCCIVYDLRWGVVLPMIPMDEELADA